MEVNTLAKIIEHNNWANLRILGVCSALSDEQLDAQPHTLKQWSIRQNLIHLVESQQGYLSLLTLPLEARGHKPLPFAELEESVRKSGEGLLAQTQGEIERQQNELLQTMDGYRVEPWVVMVQAINHATEHRKQVAGLLRTLGIDPPRLDAWAFGEATKALTRQST